jgi:hypothetical protein
LYTLEEVYNVSHSTWDTLCCGHSNLGAGVLGAGVRDVWFLGARIFVERFVVLDQLLLETLKAFVSGGVLRRCKRLGVSYLWRELEAFATWMRGGC